MLTFFEKYGVVLLYHLKTWFDSLLSNTAHDASSLAAVDEQRAQRRAWMALGSLPLVLCLAAFVRAAWLSDDAYIAFRAMNNLDQGFGLVSNPGERVQGFTNPLWVLLLAPLYLITKEIYFSAINVQLLISMTVAALLVFRAPKRKADGLLIGLLLPFSRAFTDFSTSGLENPLLHLLMTLLVLTYFSAKASPRTAFFLVFLASLLFITRMDSVLLTGPLLLHFAVTTRKQKAPKQVLWLALGLLPALLWEGFSLVYYGFPFPNTAYAKLNTDIPAGHLAMQGVGYFIDGLVRDPLTLIVVFFAILAAIVSRDKRAIVVMVGVVLYLAYVIKVGGDFMSGRFFTTSFVVALLVLARVLPMLPLRMVLGVGAIAGLVILSAPFNPLNPVVEPCNVPHHGITDERSCYYKHTGLLHNVHRSDKGWGYQTHPYWQAGRKKKNEPETVYKDMLIGLGGYAAGPRNHIVDPAALTDPLLARIPFKGGSWRIGHFYRDLPAGYIETLRTGQNQLKDPCIRKYYEKLDLVIRGPIFSIERFRAILSLNLGMDDHLLAPGCTDAS